MSKTDPVEQNIQGVRSLVGSGLNKVPQSGGSTSEGIDGDFEDEFTLKLSDQELLDLARVWENKYRPYEGKMILRQNANRQYYLGLQKEGSSEATEGKSIAANILFEAEETFLPAALAKNPEPVVWADNTPEGNALAKSVKTMLQYHADTLVLRRKLTLMTRNWSVDLLGVVKHGWDPVIGDIKTEVRDVKKMIFDPDGYVDPYGDFVGYLGEQITVSADRLVELFPKHKSFVTILVDGKMGTDVTYTQWWNDDYTFTTFKGFVLDKTKNPHFNYVKTEMQVDEDGMEQEVETGGNNHFARPKKPYTFLSVFSFGEQPHDVTGLIEQNIPNQRRISRRTEQIDYNLSRANNSDIFSQKNFNQETAKQAATAMAKGHPVLVPEGGPLSDAIHRLQGQGVDASYFNELENSKNDLRSIFGVQGITSQQPDDDQTARGMILNQQFDTTRIGGGIGDVLEQVADNIFNWWVQLYYVYYDEEHEARILGQMKAVEFITLSSVDMNKRVVVSVAPNSMKPKDETTLMNQALALYDKGALDPKTLLTILDFPDPQQTAENAVLWKVDPAAYMQLNFPELTARLAGMQQAAAAAAAGAGAGGMAPEEVTEPGDPSGLSETPASPDLSQVPLPA